MVKNKEKIIFRSGKKIILRPLMEGDLKKMLVWLNDPSVTQYLRHMFPLYEKEGKEWFEKLNDQKQTDIVLAIETKRGIHIGNIGIYRINWQDRTGNVGIFLGNKNYWGKRYGYEALILLLEYAFNFLNLRKICLSLFDFNKRAYKCYFKCGFKTEGRKKKQYYVNGKYHDEIMMAIFKTNWENNKK